MITHCEDLIATPINLGSNELVSVNELVDVVEDIAQVKLARIYEPDAPKGVAGRNSDNTMIKRVLGWEPHTLLREGMRKTYAWIEGEYLLRKSQEMSISENIQMGGIPFNGDVHTHPGARNQPLRRQADGEAAHQ